MLVAVGVSCRVKPSWGAARVVCSSSEGMQSASGQGVALKQAMFKDVSHLIVSNPPRVSSCQCCPFGCLFVF